MIFNLAVNFKDQGSSMLDVLRDLKGTSTAQAYEDMAAFLRVHVAAGRAER
jgi:hypothetical protein